MTETEWLKCTDPDDLFCYLGKKQSNRRLRLLACASCWRFGDLITEDLRGMLENAESYEAEQMSVIPLSEAAEKLKAILDALPLVDRLGLADYLWGTVADDESLSDQELQGEWEAELNRRVKETELGLDVEVSAEEVRRLTQEGFK